MHFDLLKQMLNCIFYEDLTILILVNYLFDYTCIPRPYRNHHRKVVLSDGTVKYYNAYNQLHRDNDQPAIEHANGTREWYQNGQLYRENNLPTIVWNNENEILINIY